MKHNQDYFISDYYCLRIPAQPVEAILKLNDELNEIDLNDHASLVKMLERISSTPLFQEAIYISSRELYLRYQALKAKNYPDKEKVRRLLIAFYKYYSRMSHRCTPYGIFAGLATGAITEDATRIVFDEKKYRPVFQFNIQTLTDFIRKIDAIHPSAVDTIKYEVNNTLYIMGDKMYFVEKIEKDGYLASNLTSIVLNEYIQDILDHAKGGATVNELVASMSIPNVDESQKVNFINSLVKSQVLVSELWPSVSTSDFMGDFLNKIKAKSISIHNIEELKSIYRLFKETDRIEDIETIRTYLEEQKHEEDSISNKKDFFKVDLFYNMQTNVMRKKVIEDISEMSYELMRVTKPITANTLEIFVQAFHKKYEEREVPLVQALDPNYGVGYGMVVGNGLATYTPLVADIPIALPQENPRSSHERLARIRKKALKRYCENNETVVKIDEDIKDWLKEENKEFENRTITSSYIFGSLTASSQQDLDEGKFRFRPVQLHSPYAARLLSRFLHGDDVLCEKVKKTVEREDAANPDVILAEVLYIPDGKFANISLYPTLRKYEIPYLSASKLDAANQIDVNDLLVSVRNGRVVLRSIRLNKEVVPCLSNTYDAGFGNPIFQFLSGVSYQNVSHGFIWEWGKMYYDEVFLPRIEYRNLILSRARWYVKQTKINYKDDTVLKEYFRNLSEDYNMPRFLVLAEGDNELLLDLENAICRSILAKELNKRDLFLFEFLKSPDQCFIGGEEGHYSNEILIPIDANKPMGKRFYGEDTVETPDEIARIFSPGSEWLFVKIYSGSKILESLITEVVGPFCEKLIGEKVIDKWFFIRYGDPDYHLRIRFHRSGIEDNRMWYMLLEKLQEALHAYIKEEHTIKILVDTYQRELERYGVDTMEMSESIFFADSVAIYKFLNLIYGNQGEELRWRFALVNVNMMLSDFGYDLAEKSRLMKNLSRYFFAEFSQNSTDGGKSLSRALRNKYRKFKLEIENIIQGKNKNEDLVEAYACFEERSAYIERETLKIGNISDAFQDDLVASHIHMTMNRMFLVNQRRHELVIYSFLSKCYESIIARQKIKSNEYAS